MHTSVSPVRYLKSEERKPPDTGIGICLSGGGYRAMLFHVGVLWRLAELGLLSKKTHAIGDNDVGKFERISSVSGGSITSAVLGLNWDQIKIDEPDALARFQTYLVEPIRELASRTIINIWSGIAAIILPGSINDKVVKKYEKYLYGSATLQSIPETPRFIINATNLQSGVLWRFSKPYARDYRVGKIESPTISLAKAVGASSAFPPFLSPARFKFSESDYSAGSGTDLQYAPFTTSPALSDGGVYDNLGLETVWKRYQSVLVSDAGGQTQPQPKVPTGWARQSYRVMNVIDNQVRSLRKRALIASYLNQERSGAFWGIRSNMAKFEAPGKLDCPYEKTIKLAEIETDLAKKSAETQKMLINWGYAVCDASVRAHFLTSASPPAGFPYTEIGVG